MSKLKILQLVYAFYPYSSSGNSRVAYEISKELVRRGHDVTVLTTNLLEGETMFRPEKEEYNLNGIKVHYHTNILYKPNGFVPLFYSQGVINELRKNILDFDVIHLHENRFYTSIFLHRYAKKYRVPYVLQAHGSVSATKSKQHVKMLYDLLFGFRTLRDASKVIALNQVEANQYRHAGIPDSKIAIIPNGIELADYAELPPKGRFRRRFGLDKNAKIVLYLGRVNRTKGIAFLIKAFSYMIKTMNSRKATLVIAGPDDGYSEKAMHLAENLKITNHLLFTGVLSNMEKICAYVDSDVVVNVEPANVFGLVPLEAAACAKPVIVSNGNAISEIVHSGRFGVSVNYGDILELAEYIQDMLSKDLSEMGNLGRKFVFSNFDWADIVERLEKVYREICD